MLNDIIDIFRYGIGGRTERRKIALAVLVAERMFAVWASILTEISTLRLHPILSHTTIRALTNFKGPIRSVNLRHGKLYLNCLFCNLSV